MDVFILLLFVVVLPLAYGIATYNLLVRLGNHISDAWSNVDTELNRRYDLIPRLVAAVKGYMAHERDTLERITDLRNTCMQDHGSVQHQESTEKQFVTAIQKLFALVEGYPDLKADQQFLALQKELVNTEDRIQAARRFYNGNVRDYRNRHESFPGNIVAKLFSFETRDFFNVDPAVRVAPKVEALQ